MRIRLFTSNGEYILTLDSPFSVRAAARGTIGYWDDQWWEWIPEGDGDDSIPQNWIPVHYADPKVQGLYGKAVEAEREAAQKNVRCDACKDTGKGIPGERHKNALCDGRWVAIWDRNDCAV